MDRYRCFKGILVASIVAFLACLAVISWAETVAVEFTYTGQADSYTLYMDETAYCSITEAEKETNAESNFEMSCDPINIDPGWHSFTMTATKGTEETKHSNEFQWFKDFDQEPSKPTVITITIGINGDTVILAD